MIVWLEKIWRYGGWFYLSWGVGILVAYLFPQKARLLRTVVLVLALGWAGWLYGQALSQLPEALSRLALSSAQKKAVMTLGQVPFLEQVEQVLPTQASGCLFASTDVPTHFLKQRLYPRRFRLIQEGDTLEDCEYVISQYRMRDLIGYFPLVVVSNNVLYKRQ